MEGSKTLFCSPNFSWVRERIPSKFTNAPWKRFTSSGLY